MKNTERHPRALRDIDEHHDYLSEWGGLELAERFVNSLDKSIGTLAEYPDIGKPLPTTRPQLKGLRYWPVKDFRRYLIFYLVRGETVKVLRVMHGKQNWCLALGIDGNLL